MTTDWAIRLLEAVAIMGVATGLYRLGNQIILARASARSGGGGLPTAGRTVIMYFTAPGCAPCKTIQRPALDDLKGRLGRNLEIVEVDATARPDLARSWGVLSVPTTFVVDTHGRSRFVNHGAVTADKLWRQLMEIMD